MFKPDPRPNPADVGCKVYKQCAEKCGTCRHCKDFAHMLTQIAPNDVPSRYTRTTFEWRES